MVPLGESAKDETPSDNLQSSESSDTETGVSKETTTNGVSTPSPDRVDELPSIKSEKTRPVSDSSADVSHSNLCGKSSPKRPKKELKVREPSANQAFQSGHEVSTPLSIREKISEDGYNWRKYGQKLVKGNEYVRSYYRCTYPSCQVKKQLERLHEGKIVDIVYFGQHAHPKPQVNNVPVSAGFAVSTFEDRQKEPSSSSAEDSVVHVREKSPRTPQTKPVYISQISIVSANNSFKGTISQSSKMKDESFSNDDPDSKRQKRDKDTLKSTSVDKPTSDPRTVVQTRSEVDLVNDGFRWRKYGQKLVKGSPNPRSYYRCSNSGCPVKKHVERASHDPKVVITTYEGQHSHDAPPSQTVTHNISDSTTSVTDGKSTCLDMVVDVIIERESEKPEQQLGSKSPSRLGENKNKPEKGQINNSVAKEESESVINNNLDDKLSSKSEGDNNSCVVDAVVKNEVQNPDSEPVQG